ncbi:hypothetical protein [Paenibacillus sp. Marseille-Q4541]|uniref:hypothetical protein n=1 Tax=Paenibacillus sp. Marseille-Q4541 TaxID=2831522 RepID=UPI001BAD80F5|nr:hypothetical protein [Paenibacillus sp. Marseille-Q4541]
MGYGIKMHHKYGPKSYIATLSYKPSLNDIIEIEGEFYEVLVVQSKPRICYATYASNLDIFRVTGVYPA